jgi:two-component system cell cycle sensor histidine kinase/response regulator CckA
LLVAGLMIAIVTTLQMKSNVDMKAEHEFVSHCNDLERLISDRLRDYARTLLSGAALFNAAETVTREQWRIFTNYLKLEEQFPGTQGIGFSLLIPRAELPRHIQKIRSEGFPHYTVKPDGDREVYSSVIYLEPFSERNLRSFGYDMLPDPVRRSAMEYACDTNSATLSGKVALVQETDKDIQAGALMYVPVYRKGMPTDTVEQRRAAIYGWVYSPYRMNDLMRGIFVGLSLEKKKDFHFEVFDGGNPSPKNLLYENFPEENRAQRRPVRFTRQISHVFNGEPWLLCFTQTGGGFFTAEYAKVWFFLIGSTLISLLLFALVLTLLNISDKAQQMAEKLTVDLREKTSILSGLLTSIPDMVFFKTKEGVYLGCNPEFARFANRAIPDIVGSTDYDLFDKEIADFFRTQDRIMMEHNMPRHNEEWVQYPDGARVLLDTAKAPLMDADGRVLGLLGVGRDITDLKRATMELQNISERLSLAVRAGGVGIWDWDVVNNCLVWDEQMFRLYGTASDKFSSAYEAWQAGLHPDDRQRGDEEIRLALSGEKELNTEFRALWPDGTVRNIRAQAIVQRDAAGHPLHMLGTNWDITAHIESENALKESEKRFTQLAEQTRNIAWEVDPQGMYTYISGVSMTVLGYRPDELVGRMHFYDLHPESGREEFKQCAFAIFAQKQAFHNLENTAQTKDGQQLWLSTNGLPLLGIDGRLLGYRGSDTDITDRKYLEAEKARLEARNRQLHKADSLGLMSGAIAHHFNNKLSVVQGYLEMVIRELPLRDPHAEKLTRALQSAQKASALSGNLLAYLGQIRNKIESLDLSEICNVSLPVLLAGMPKNVALETDLPSPGPYISADPKQIQNILTSLVINAWEAIGEETGTVRLSVKIVSTADIPTAHRFPLEWQPKEQTYACLEVTDSGCGIQEKDVEKIFDPFFSTKFTGRGLGLSIVLGIAKTHGAAITVENRVGGGSVFRVFFPLSVQMETRQNKQIAKAPEIAAGGTVLLVEDEAALREMTRLALVHFGFTVLLASDGIEAVEIFGQHKDEISCVMSDLTMPRMDGWETIAALRAIRHELPVILASGYDEARAMAGEHTELPDIFLNKPYDINKLGDIIGKAIARKF